MVREKICLEVAWAIRWVSDRVGGGSCRQSVPKCRHIKSRRRVITQKKAYNIQNTAKAWNQESICLSAHLPIYPSAHPGSQLYSTKTGCRTKKLQFSRWHKTPYNTDFISRIRRCEPSKLIRVSQEGITGTLLPRKLGVSQCILGAMNSSCENPLNGLRLETRRKLIDCRRTKPESVMC